MLFLVWRTLNAAGGESPQTAWVIFGYRLPTTRIRVRGSGRPCQENEWGFRVGLLSLDAHTSEKGFSSRYTGVRWMLGMGGEGVNCIETHGAGYVIQVSSIHGLALVFLILV